MFHDDQVNLLSSTHKIYIEICTQEDARQVPNLIACMASKVIMSYLTFLRYRASDQTSSKEDLRHMMPKLESEGS